MLTDAQKTKYTARNWLMRSPQGKYTAVLSLDQAVSLAWVESHFCGGWQIRALFDHEHSIALGKVQRAGK